MFFLPKFVCISVRWIFNQNFCFVSNLLCGQHTWDILLALSLCEIHVGNLGVLSYGRNQEADRGALHRSSDQRGNAFVQLQHSPNFCQPCLAVPVQGRLQRWVLQRLFQNSSFPVGCSSAQGRGSCPELCAWQGAAMHTIIYLPGAVLQTWGFMASFQDGWILPKGPPNLHYSLIWKIFLVIGKLACSSQSQQCYRHVSIGTSSSVAFFCPPKFCLSKICPNLSWDFFYLSLEHEFFSLVFSPCFFFFLLLQMAQCHFFMRLRPPDSCLTWSSVLLWAMWICTVLLHRFS